MHRVVRFACGLACASALQMPFTRMPRTASRGESPRMIASLFDLMGGGEPSMVAPENALPGRDKKMMINDRHRVLGTKMDDVPEGHKVAVFANGCFWGSEKGIWRLPAAGGELEQVRHALPAELRELLAELAIVLTGDDEALRAHQLEMTRGEHHGGSMEFLVAARLQ